jgi:hypothetical protein
LDKEKKKAKQIVDSHIVVERIIQRLVLKHVRTNFNNASNAVVIKEIRNIFHINFVICFKTHLLRFRGVNLGFLLKVQKSTRARVMA